MRYTSVGIFSPASARIRCPGRYPQRRRPCQIPGAGLVRVERAVPQEPLCRHLRRGHARIGIRPSSEQGIDQGEPFTQLEPTPASRAAVPAVPGAKPGIDRTGSGVQRRDAVEGSVRIGTLLQQKVGTRSVR